MLSDKLIINLNKKLENIVLELVRIKLDRKQANSLFKERIKEAEDKMQCIAETLNSGDCTLLASVFSSPEIDDMETFSTR